MAYAQAVVSACITVLSPEMELFKKVDSVFRGNTQAEIAAVVRAAGDARVLVAPAYPVMGRRLLGGRVEIHEAGRTRTLALADELGRWLGVPPALVPAGTAVEEIADRICRAERSGRRVLLCDATEQPHLEALVAAVRGLGGRTIWVGSGGLAHALAGSWPMLNRPPEVIAPRTGTVVFFIGSSHPVMRGQVLHLERMSGLRSCPCGDAVADAATPAMLLSIDRGCTPDEEIRLAVEAAGYSGVGCLFLSGGDTARQVCRALGITALRLEREFAPGVPQAVAEGGPFAGATVLLKSGGFGERDLLCHVLDAFSATVVEPSAADGQSMTMGQRAAVNS